VARLRHAGMSAVWSLTGRESGRAGGAYFGSELTRLRHWQCTATMVFDASAHVAAMDWLRYSRIGPGHAKKSIHHCACKLHSSARDERSCLGAIFCIMVFGAAVTFETSSAAASKVIGLLRWD